jgi:hypothetical protein
VAIRSALPFFITTFNIPELSGLAVDVSLRDASGKGGEPSPDRPRIPQLWQLAVSNPKSFLLHIHNRRFPHKLSRHPTNSLAMVGPNCLEKVLNRIVRDRF